MSVSGELPGIEPRASCFKLQVQWTLSYAPHNHPGNFTPDLMAIETSYAQILN